MCLGGDWRTQWCAHTHAPIVDTHCCHLLFCRPVTVSLVIRRWHEHDTYMRVQCFVVSKEPCSAFYWSFSSILLVVHTNIHPSAPLLGAWNWSCGTTHTFNLCYIVFAQWPFNQPWLCIIVHFQVPQKILPNQNRGLCTQVALTHLHF